ncbi:proline-serine-threonine phosphatase-interacting protein 2 [Hemiscyllium ocellatum]|uniref:proline-serine-threonine phosphatase-interacting protein 2 n=1 Tax=Hemiscyllium ocellatum TaxID=170820 RepID=UPI0029660FC2|nr:proline-serine-threonine phosphatase-interacting protein 2 [Hemiscyllium ocellatum]
MREPRFRDNFWSTDITSSIGYDNLIQHMNDGRKTCKELEDFVKQRASIEEKYGKDLMSLSKKVCGQNELNTLKRAFDVFKQQMENVGLLHIQLAGSLREEVKKLEEFREKQKDQRKKLEHCMENLHKQKTVFFKKTIESKKTYEQKCKDKDEAEQMLNRSSGISNSRQQDKLQSKANQSKQSAEDADRTYHQNVLTLEKIREEWQSEHIRTCEFLEKQDCERIHTMRNAMWVHANQLSQGCVSSDEMYEEIRKVLEQCNIQRDLEFFIDLKRTGDTAPAPIPYENYYSGQRGLPPTRAPVATRRMPLPTPDNSASEPQYATVGENNYSHIRHH